MTIYPSAASCDTIKDIGEKIKIERLKLKKLKDEIGSREKEIDEVKKKEDYILINLDNINDHLHIKEKEFKIYEWEAGVMKERIKEIEDRFKDTDELLQRKKLLLGRRLRALYKEGGGSYLNVIFSAPNFTELLQRFRFMKIIAMYDADLIASFKQDLLELGQVKEELSQKRDTIALLMENALEKKEEIGLEKKKKEELLREIRYKKNVYLKTQQELKDASQELLSFITTFKKKHKEEGEEGKSRFSERKGNLIWPVNGEVILPYGKIKKEEFNTYIFHNGMDIKAPIRSDIKAVHDGEVLFSDWLKGYGRSIIIDHGDSYYSIYAHIDETLVKVSDKVKRDQVIAKVGESGSLQGPSLYFEIRYKGKPEDPMEWLQTKN
ncbi:MAG: peptidoglycan DD-metalloendopeptidase family protein [Nitrospinae bacterium]|nr:peptidoglycan DD-metalloendopeptidase family protein [Nitrospinota bacterium]